jgi:hypothetical protein
MIVLVLSINSTKLSNLGARRRSILIGIADHVRTKQVHVLAAYSGFIRGAYNRPGLRYIFQPVKESRERYTIMTPPSRPPCDRSCQSKATRSSLPVRTNVIYVYTHIRDNIFSENIMQHRIAPRRGPVSTRRYVYRTVFSS